MYVARKSAVLPLNASDSTPTRNSFDTCRHDQEKNEAQSNAKQQLDEVKQERIQQQASGSETVKNDAIQ